MSYSGNNILSRLSDALEIERNKSSKPKTEATVSFHVAQDKYNKAVEKLSKEDNVEYCRKVLSELKSKMSELTGKVSATYTAKNEEYYSKIKKLNEMISNLEGLIRDYEAKKQLNGYHYDLEKNGLNKGSSQYTRLYWMNPINPIHPGDGNEPYTDAGNTDGSAN